MALRRSDILIEPYRNKWTTPKQLPKTIRRLRRHYKHVVMFCLLGTVKNLPIQLRKKMVHAADDKLGVRQRLLEV